MFKQKKSKELVPNILSLTSSASNEDHLALLVVLKSRSDTPFLEMGRGSDVSWSLVGEVLRLPG